MRAILLAILFCGFCCGQGALFFGGQTQIPSSAPVDSNSGGGCTGSSGAWTCTGMPTITLTCPGTTCYYHLSGTPNCLGTSGTLYTGAFSGSGSTFTLKAIACNGITGGAVLTSVYTITSGVTYVSSTANTSLNGGACGGPGNVCTWTGITYANTGDTILLAFDGCLDATCGNDAASISSLTASDGTNTYTWIPGCTVNLGVIGGSRITTTCLYATNVTAGTYTVAVTVVTGNQFFNPILLILEMSGANASAPLDASITNAVTNSASANPSITSTGNVSASGELAIAFSLTQSANTFTWTAPFTQKVHTSFVTAGTSYDLSFAVESNPTSGTTVTAAGTQTSGGYNLAIVGFKQ